MFYLTNEGIGGCVAHGYYFGVRILCGPVCVK